VTGDMASNPLDQPCLDASLVTDPLHEASEALVECLERRIGGVVDSSMDLYYETLYGLLLMSDQSFRAIGTLVSDNAGDRIFPVQAAILARTMLEGLGNILVLREAPEERARLYGLDVTRNLRASRRCTPQRSRIRAGRYGYSSEQSNFSGGRLVCESRQRSGKTFPTGQSLAT
jgi:hypothetical protein